VTLDQFQALKQWHTRHRADHPLEKNIWELVLTLWIAGWVGGAATLVLDMPLATLLCIALLSLPHTYVSLRTRLHRARRLRCDWIDALR